MRQVFNSSSSILVLADDDQTFFTHSAKYTNVRRPIDCWPTTMCLVFRCIQYSGTMWYLILYFHCISVQYVCCCCLYYFFLLIYRNAMFDLTLDNRFYIILMASYWWNDLTIGPLNVFHLWINCGQNRFIQNENRWKPNWLPISNRCLYKQIVMICNANYLNDA